LTLSPLARDFRAKAARALASARELQDRDPDGSVNRSYYAMFDIARAALCRSRSYAARRARIGYNCSGKMSASQQESPIPKMPTEAPRTIKVMVQMMVSMISIWLVEACLVRIWIVPGRPMVCTRGDATSNAG
jgi:hypothetical protein